MRKQTKQIKKKKKVSTFPAACLYIPQRIGPDADIPLLWSVLNGSSNQAKSN